MTVSSCWQWSLVLLGIFWAPATARAVEVHPPLENKITQALKTKHAVDFVNVPLPEVLKQLGTAANVPYFIDRIALEDEGVEFQSPVTLKRDAQEIAITLQEVLHPLYLDYDARPEWLFVSSRAALDETLDNRFYDVSRLVTLIQPRLILSRSPFTDNPPTRGYPWGNYGPTYGGPYGHAQFGGAGLCGGMQDAAKEKATHRFRIEELDPRFPAETYLMAFLQENTSG